MAGSTTRAARTLVLWLGARGLHGTGGGFVGGGLGRLGLGGLGLGRLRLGRVGLAVFLARGLDVVLLGARLFLVRTVQVALVFLVRLEIGFVPARALQPEHRRGHQLLQALLAAVRTLGQRLVGDLLQHLFVIAAVWAFVLVERHPGPRVFAPRL